MSEASVLFRIVRVFDGVSEARTPARWVLVSGATIERIADAPIEASEGDVRAIDPRRSATPSPRASGASSMAS